MDTNTQTHTLTLPWVEAATAGFVNAQAMREAFSLAVAAGLNLIFSGPGGHGKSEFLMAAIGATGVEAYVKSFGQGTSPEELYGGIDLDALNRQGEKEKAVIQYMPDLSFLAHPIAVFEEFLDGPPRVLTSLKDTLTARALRNGHQYYPMETSVICGATNHSPQDIAEGGREIAALIERFPIQLEVTWPCYTEEAYVELFDAVTDGTPDFDKITWDDVVALQEQARNVTLSRVMRRMLARIIVELRRDNVVISPRTAVLAMRLAKAAAAINGRDRATAHDLLAIAFLPGAYSLKSRISELIEEHMLSLVGEEELDRFEEVFTEASELVATTEETLESLVRVFDDIRDRTRTLKLSMNQANRRRSLLERVGAAKAEAQASLKLFELERQREEHKVQLDELARQITQLNQSLRHTTGTRREKVRHELDNVLQKLHMMKVHPDLDAYRLELQMKLRLAGIN